MLAKIYEVQGTLCTYHIQNIKINWYRDLILFKILYVDIGARDQLFANPFAATVPPVTTYNVSSLLSSVSSLLLTGVVVHLF